MKLNRIFNFTQVPCNNGISEKAVEPKSPYEGDELNFNPPSLEEMKRYTEELQKHGVYVEHDPVEVNLFKKAPEYEDKNPVGKIDLTPPSSITNKQLEEEAAKKEKILQAWAKPKDKKKVKKEFFWEQYMLPKMNISLSGILRKMLPWKSSSIDVNLSDEEKRLIKFRQEVAKKGKLKFITISKKIETGNFYKNVKENVTTSK